MPQSWAKPAEAASSNSDLFHPTAGWFKEAHLVAALAVSSSTIQAFESEVSKLPVRSYNGDKYMFDMGIWEELQMHTDVRD